MTSALRHENDQGFASIERELAALKQMDVMNAGAIETEFSVAANVLAFEPAEG
jgi:hypothetical protein